MSGIAADTPTQPIVAPTQQTEQPAAVHAEPTAASATAQPIHDTATRDQISQEPPTYNETFAKNQMQYNQAANNHPSHSQGRMVTPLERLGEEPALVDCPYCKKVTTTRVGSEHSTMTVYVLPSHVKLILC